MYVARAVQSKYHNCTDRMKLGCTDCIEVLVTVSEHMLITIVLDAFDKCDRSKSPRLVSNLQEVIRQSSMHVKVLISTRAFPTIEDQLHPPSLTTDKKTFPP